MRLPRHRLILLSLLFLGFVTFGENQFVPGKTCFCKDSEAVEACPCVSDSIDAFNNEKVYPLLHRLLQKDFFKFYKVSLNSWVYIYL